MGKPYSLFPRIVGVIKTRSDYLDIPRYIEDGTMEGPGPYLLDLARKRFGTDDAGLLAFAIAAGGYLTGMRAVLALEGEPRDTGSAARDVLDLFPSSTILRVGGVASPVDEVSAAGFDGMRIVHVPFVPDARFCNCFADWNEKQGYRFTVVRGRPRQRVEKVAGKVVLVVECDAVARLPQAIRDPADPDLERALAAMRALDEAAGAAGSGQGQSIKAIHGRVIGDGQGEVVERTVRRWVDRLVSLGLVRRVPRRDPNNLHAYELVKHVTYSNSMFAAWQAEIQMLYDEAMRKLDTTIQDERSPAKQHEPAITRIDRGNKADVTKKHPV